MTVALRGLVQGRGVAARSAGVVFRILRAEMNILSKNFENKGRFEI